MNSIQTDFWALPLPEEWSAEVDEETVIIQDSDGVSTLELSIIELDGESVSPQDLQDLAGELIPAGVPGSDVTLGDWVGQLYEYVDEDYCRDWLVASDIRVLLISYTCALDDKGMDDAAVNEILAELARVNEES